MSKSLVPEYPSSGSDSEPQKKKQKKKIILDFNSEKIEFSSKSQNPENIPKTSNGLFSKLPAPKSQKSHSITQPNIQSTFNVKINPNPNAQPDVEIDSYFSLPNKNSRANINVTNSHTLSIKPTFQTIVQTTSASSAYAFPSSAQHTIEIATPENPEYELPQDIDLHQLHKLGHKSTEGPIEFIQVNQYENLIQEREHEAMMHASGDKTKKSHIAPAKDTRKRHTIMSLAAQARANQSYLDEQRANLKSQRKLAKTKYGF